MKTPFLTLLLLFSLHGYSQENTPEQEINITLRLLNDVRIAAGLDTVALSEELSKGCYNHAKYLVINDGHELTEGLEAHKEYTQLKGYTVEGAKAGENAVIHYIRPSLAMDGWIRTFYHRMPLLQPGLKEVGIGYFEADGQTVALVECISGVSGENNIPVVFYPNDGQTNVPLEMGDEIPHPVGEHGAYGFPITVYFTQWQEVTQAQFRLLDTNKRPVTCHVSNPEQPATFFHQWTTICAIPTKPLNPNSQYTGIVSCLVDGKPFKKEFSFRTGEMP